MSFLRKILVGLVSLTMIVGIYVMYSRSSKTPPIRIGSDTDIGDSNIPTVDGQGGKIGNLEIPVLKNPVYRGRRPNGEVEREFGFAELVRTIGDVWEVDKPWMKVYQRNFEFHIRADQGTTELQTVVGSSTPKDATFQGNVTIRILPLDETTYKKTTIHLDNLMFLSDKSLFTTPGPVKLVSEDINMDGRGLEFVYNDQTERVEYFRLQHLEALRIKGSAQAVFTNSDSQPSQQSQQSAPKPDTPVVARKPDTPVVSRKHPADDAAKTTPAPASDTAKTAPPEYYKCILSENVLIETPDEIVFARQEISLHDILWSETTIVDDANGVTGAKAPGAPRTTAAEIKAGGPKPNPPTQPAQEVVEMVVTCDNGILLVPMNSKRTLADFPRPKTDKPRDLAYRPKAFDDPNGRSTFLTPRIDYNSVSGDAIAAGPTELVFYTGSMMALEPNETSVPVTVTSTKDVHLIKESNQALFYDCLLTMPQQGLVQARDITFTASQFTVNLPTNTPGQDRVPGDIIAAGPVELIFYVEDSNAAVTKEPPVPVSITAQHQAQFIPDSNQVIFDVNCVCTMQPSALPTKRNFILTSPRFIANLPAERDKATPSAPDVIALGPVRLESYIDPFDSNDPNAAPLPATITATKHARFLPAANQVLFEGDSKAVVVREDPNFIEYYILSSQKIVVDLPADSNERSSKSAMGIEHLTASGGVVTLATKKMAGEKQLSGIEVISRKFDYDPNQELFTITGPAEIWLDNSNLIGDPNDQTGAFSLKKPCWARIQNFDLLQYFQSKNQIIADAASDGPLVVRYIPIKDGKLGDVRIVTASHVEANLVETALGGTELATLTASGGITYQAGDHEFIGGQLFYDHAKQLMKVIGSESFPCMVDGMLTDEIEYDLKTDTIKADLVGPGGVRFQ